MAHEATLLQDAQQVLAQQRDQAKSHFEGLMGPTPADDDMGMHIGDVIHPPAATPAPAARSPSVLSWLPVALSAASLLGTGGIGLLVASKLASIAVPAGGAAAAIVQPPAMKAKDIRVRFWIESGKAKFGEPESVQP